MEIRSLLPPEDTIAFIQKHLLHGAVIEQVRRKETWSIPPVAIREAIINAIVHADYALRGSPIRVAIFDDRIEIENPGLLPFWLTLDDIQCGVSKLRNRVIGRVFHELRLIEQWDSGVQRMTSACLEAGLDAPVFEEIGTHFRVTIPSVRKNAPLTDEIDPRILVVLGKSRAPSTAAIAKLIGLSERATRNRLRSLISRGLAVDIGTGRHDPRCHYALVGSRS